jgi:AraC-like DNA-binding protein
MLVLNVEFTAVGLRALTGLSPKEIADRAVEACTIFGSGIQRLHEELSAHGESLQKMAASVEIFLLKRLAAARIMPHIEVASSIARMFERSGGTVDVSVVADRFSLSTRQLERTFQEHVGIGPKTFAKLQRLNRALRLKGAEPALTWAEIAATCGYFDQAHLGRDFRMMTNETPVRFAALSSIGKNLWKSQRK